MVTHRLAAASVHPCGGQAAQQVPAPGSWWLLSRGAGATLGPAIPSAQGSCSQRGLPGGSSRPCPSRGGVGGGGWEAEASASARLVWVLLTSVLP